MKQKLEALSKFYPYVFYTFFLYNAAMSFVSLHNGSALEWISHTAWAVLNYFFYMDTKNRTSIVQNVSIQATTKEDLETAVKSVMEQMRKGGR